jgi:asparagine synthase (glutamine-hydrolysing)
MPGIVGVLDPEYGTDDLGKLLDRMCSIITHEPWYQTHTYVRPPVAGARVGLGIINPQPQPASNEDSSVIVWMDGEIYDFQRQALTRQLRRSGHTIMGQGDAELIAHLYEELGESCVCDLDGTFAIAIYDSRLDKLMIAVDRDASRPLYFTADEGRFLFACEVKAILEDERVPRQVNEQAAVELFTFRHVLADRTLIRDVRYLPAGCVAVYQHGQVQVRSYWVPAIVEDQPHLARETYVDEIIAALRRALERQMYDERPIGEFLSGGMDSRTLAGLAPPLDGRFHTFSRGPEDCWDVRFGAMVAQRVGSQHHFLNLEPDFLLNMGRKGVWITDGLMTVNDIYMLGIIDQVRPHVDVVFLGLGRGDGVLAGIDLDRRLLQATTLDEVARIHFAHNGNFVPQSIQARVLSRPFYQRTHGVAFDALRQMLGQYDSDTFHGLIETYSTQCYGPRAAWWGAFLCRTQVETRTPYSDNELYDLLCRVPARWRLDRQMQLAVIKRSRPDLARVPWDYTGLPASMCSPKVIRLRRVYFRARREIESLTRGLVPAVRARQRANYALWYRTVLRSWLEDILLDERTLARGYYDAKGLRQLIEEHMRDQRDRSVQFGLLLTFELWNRMFIDQESPKA